MIIRITETFTKTEHTFDVYYLSGYTRFDVPIDKLTKTMLHFLNHCITFSRTPEYKIHERNVKTHEKNNTPRNKKGDRKN